MFKKRFGLPVLLVFLGLAFARPILAGNALEDRVQEFTLPNGMKFLVVERHQSPVVAMYLRFKVGSVDEWTGYSGIAHFLEHMLFKGTTTLGTTNWKKEKAVLESLDSVGKQLDEERLKGDGSDAEALKRLEERLAELSKEHRQYVVKDEIDEIYSKAGGVGFNAFTSRDTTTYVLALPSNKLELWARIEADRMANPVLREFWSERDVVQEERRRSYDSSPGGTLYERFLATAFMAHPYRSPTIGWMSEIKFLNLENTQRFRKTFYAPNNTVCGIVGDVDVNQVSKLAARYFGPIPSQPLPRALATEEPEQKGEKRIIIEFDASPMLTIGYHKPTVPSRDDYVFDVIDSILSSGRTSRLYRRLVEKDQLATSVSTTNGTPGARYDNLFAITAIPRHPHAPEEVEKAIYEELDRLADEPVEEKELQKVINQLEASMIRGMASNNGLASTLTYFEVVAGDWRYIARFTDVIRTITAEEIQKTARKYFVSRNRTVATLVRKGGDEQ